MLSWQRRKENVNDTEMFLIHNNFKTYEFILELGNIWTKTGFQFVFKLVCKFIVQNGNKLNFVETNTSILIKHESCVCPHFLTPPKVPGS